MMKPKRPTTTMLTVDTGPDHRARFYVLQVGGRGSDHNVREDLLVVEGDELKTTHRHENLDEAA